MKKISTIICLAFLIFSSCKEGKLNTLPEVNTLPASVIDLTHVTLSGNITDEGQTAVTTRGFCWSLTANPTVNDEFSINEFGPGQYSFDIEVLPDQTYYFKAYATNSIGTSYGSEQSFTTSIVRGHFTDSRDGHIYQSVKINSQTWMAENLAYLPEISLYSVGSIESPNYYVYYYKGNSVAEAKGDAFCIINGVLYNFMAAKTACPTGWHLPSNEEWQTLTDYLGPQAGGKLKEIGNTHWQNPNKGATDECGFTARPGGIWYNGFDGLRIFSYFWTSTVLDENFAKSFVIGTIYDYVYFDDEIKYAGLSVRCIKD